MPPPSPISPLRLTARLLTALTAVFTSAAAAAQQPLIHYAIPPALVASALTARLPSLTPDRIQLSSIVSSTVADPALHLLAADLRPDGNLSLRLACRTSAECLPFFATLSAIDRADALTLLSSLRGPAPTAAAISPATPPPASPDTHAARVSVGTHVRLQLSDLQMHIQIEGIAIDSAEAGHEVRIASLDRRHTYRGIVVDATTVKGDLP